jgi:hypothetical protein
MRTTVTLDPDLEVRLKELAHERGISFKAAINAAVRAGLASETGQPRRYRERVTELGVQPGIDLTKALRLSASLEDDATVQKLMLRK